MNIIKQSINLLSSPVRVGRRLGSSAINTMSREDHVARLVREEPLDRAGAAIDNAARAAKRGDEELVIFSVLRAANAIEEIAKNDTERASEIGPKLANAALAVPDGDLGARVVEQALAKGLNATVKMIDKNVHYLQRPKLGDAK